MRLESGVGRAVVHALLQGDEPPGETGVLDFVDHQVNQTTGTISVRGLFANADRRLIPGFYAKLVIDVGPDRQALVLPRSVVQTDQEGDYVFTVDDGHRAHRRAVTIAPLPSETVEVLGGLAAGDPVVVEGGAKLFEGVMANPHPAGQAG